MDASTRRAAAVTLAEAARSGTPIPPLTETYPGLDIRDAYSIQMVNVDERVKEGAAVRGHKVGLALKTMRGGIGSIDPDYGHLMNDMFVLDGGVLSVSSYIQPRVAGSLAFVLGQPLLGGGITMGDVLRATEFVLPCIEVTDSRIANWGLQVEDIVADNGNAAGVVLGGRATKLDGLDLQLMGSILSRCGQSVESGVGVGGLRSPLVAVAWLANRLYDQGIAVEEGHVVLPGTCTRPISVEPGDIIRVDCSGLGDVALAFE